MGGTYISPERMAEAAQLLIHKELKAKGCKCGGTFKIRPDISAAYYEAWCARCNTRARVVAEVVFEAAKANAQVADEGSNPKQIPADHGRTLRDELDAEGSNVLAAAEEESAYERMVRQELAHSFAEAAREEADPDRFLYKSRPGAEGVITGLVPELNPLADQQPQFDRALQKNTDEVLAKLNARIAEEEKRDQGRRKLYHERHAEAIEALFRERHVHKPGQPAPNAKICERLGQVECACYCGTRLSFSGETVAVKMGEMAKSTVGWHRQAREAGLDPVVVEGTIRQWEDAARARGLDPTTPPGTEFLGIMVHSTLKQAQDALDEANASNLKYIEECLNWEAGEQQLKRQIAELASQDKWAEGNAVALRGTIDQLQRERDLAVEALASEGTRGKEQLEDLRNQADAAHASLVSEERTSQDMFEVNKDLAGKLKGLKDIKQQLIVAADCYHRELDKTGVCCSCGRNMRLIQAAEAERSPSGVVNLPDFKGGVSIHCQGTDPEDL